MQKYFYILLLVPLFAFGAGCSSSTNDSTSSSDSQDTIVQNDSVIEDTTNNDELATSTPEDAVQKYTLEEIAKHTTPEDCWFAIHGKVYDVSGFGDKHGGAEAVYEGCGIDATELFETRPMGSGTPHSDKARSFMPNFEIGELE